jgi:hypothetical protein
MAAMDLMVEVVDFIATSPSLVLRFGNKQEQVM